MNTMSSSSQEEKSFLMMCEQIAGELAGRSYSVVDGFLAPGDVDHLLARITEKMRDGSFKDAGVGAAHQFQVNRTIRKDRICWIDPRQVSPGEQLVLDRVQLLMKALNRACFLGLKDSEMHYAVYPPGAFYKRHLDQFKVSDHRRLTFLFYLNTGWTREDGGVLRLYLPQKDGSEQPLDIVPAAGRFVCFRSDLLEHEVGECRKTRYSLTGWMLDQLNELTFL